MVSDYSHPQNRKYSGLIEIILYLGVGLSAVIYVVGLALNVLQVSTFVLPVLVWIAIGAGSYVVFTGAIILHLHAEKRSLALQLHMVKAARSSLQIVFQCKEPMWVAKERRYRVCVQNNGQARADNVEVKLDRIEPASPLRIDVLPSVLGRKDGGTVNCGINPGVRDYFDLLQDVSLEGGTDITSTRGPRTLALYTVSNMGQHFELDPSVDYRFVISVSAADGASDERTLLVRHRLNNELQLELLPPAPAS